MLNTFSLTTSGVSTTIDTVQLTITEELLSFYVDTLGYSMFYFKDFEIITQW